MEGYPVTFKYVRPTYPIGEKIFIRFQRLVGSTDLWTPKIGDWVAIVKADSHLLNGWIYRKGLTQQLVDLFKQTGESCVVIEQEELPLVDIGVDYHFVYFSGVVIKGISSKFYWISPRGESLISLNVPMTVGYSKSIEQPSQQHWKETQTLLLPKSLSKDQLLKKRETEVKPQVVVSPKVEEKVDILKFLDNLKLNPTQCVPTIEELIHQNDRLIESLREKQNQLVDLKRQSTEIKQVGQWLKSEKLIPTKVHEKLTPVVESEKVVTPQLPKIQLDLAIQRVWPVLTTIMIDGRLPENFCLPEFLNKEFSELKSTTQFDHLKALIEELISENGLLCQQRKRVDTTKHLTSKGVDSEEFRLLTGVPVEMWQLTSLWKKIGEWKPTVQIETLKSIYEELLSQNELLHQRHNKLFPTMKSVTKVPESEQVRSSWYKLLSGLKETQQIETLKSIIEELVMDNQMLHQRHNKLQPTMKSAWKFPENEEIRSLTSLPVELVQFSTAWKQMCELKPTVQFEALTGLYEELLGQNEMLHQKTTLTPTTKSESKRLVSEQARPKWWWIDDQLDGLTLTQQIETLKSLIEELVMDNQLLHQRHNTLHPTLKSVCKLESEKVHLSTSVPTDMLQLTSLWKKIGEWQPTVQIETLRSLYEELLSQNELLHQRHNTLHPTMKSVTKVPVSEQVCSTPVVPTIPVKIETVVELIKNKDLPKLFESLKKDQFCWEKIDEELRGKIEESLKNHQLKYQRWLSSKSTVQPLTKKWEQPITRQWEQPITKQWEQPMTKQLEQPMTKKWEQPMTKQWEQPIVKDTVKCLEKKIVSDDVITLCPVCGINKPQTTQITDFCRHVNSHFSD